MNEQQIFDKVCELIALQLGVDAAGITMDTRMKQDLQADSINTLGLVMDLEQEFNIQVNDDMLEQIKTVGDIVRGIAGLV